MSGCAPRQLTDILKHGSDVHLLFGEEVVPAHSLILKQWSGVLRNALLASSSSSDSITSSESSTRTISECVTTIPMEGTSREDWLVAMEFMYPVVPQPEVTWKDLEVLFTMGFKYDMSAILDKAGRFLACNRRHLDNKPDGPYFAWNWITLADVCGCADAAQSCIDAVMGITEVMAACKKDVLVGMSPATMQHLLGAITQAWPMPGPGAAVAHCQHCKRACRMKVGSNLSMSGTTFCALQCTACSSVWTQ